MICHAGQIYAVPANAVVDIAVGPGCDFATLQEARDAIRYWLIPASATAKITLAAGKFTASRQVIFNHPYESRITVAGQPLTYIGSPTAVSVVSNGPGNHDVTYTLPGHGLAVDKWVRVRGLAGSGDIEVLAGAWKVTAVPNADQFTVKVTARRGAYPGLSVTAGAIDAWRTELHFTGADLKSPHFEHAVDPGAVEVIGMGGQLESLILTSDGQDADAHGIMLCHSAYLRAVTDVGVHGFAGNGVWCLYNSHLEQAGMAVSNCGVQGIAAQFGGVVSGSNLISTGHISHAARARAGGMVAIPNAVLSGSLVGLSGEDSGSVWAPSSKIVGNSLDNIIIEKWARGFVQNATIKGAAGQAVRAKEGGTVDACGASITGGITPSANAIQNDQSLIVTNWAAVT